MPKRLFSLVVIAILACTFLLITGTGTARADDWTKVADKGIDGSYSPFAQMVTATTQDATSFYVSTQTIPGGFAVWRFDGMNWTNIAKEGLGNPDNVGMPSMCIYNGALYAGATRAPGMYTGASLYTYDGSGWTEITSDGFGNENLESFDSMEIFEGKLYVGSFNTQEGTMLYCFDGTTWSRANENGFGQGASNADTEWLVSDGSNLYAGVRNMSSGCKLLRYEGGTTWSQLGTDGLGNPNNLMVPAGYCYGTELGTYILMGTMNQTDGAELLLYDIAENKFTQVNRDGFGDTNSWYIGAITFYGGNFYVGIDHHDEHGGAAPCQLWSYAGTNWTDPLDKWGMRLDGGAPGAQATATAVTTLDTYKNRMFITFMCSGWPIEIYSTLDGTNWNLEASPGWLSHYNEIVWSLAPYNGELYAGTYNPYTGAEVYRREGDGWTAVETGGFGRPDINWAVSNMVEYDGFLYAGTGTGLNDACGVYRYDGSGWAQVNLTKFGNPKNMGIASMAVYNGKLYVSTWLGNEVWCYDGSGWSKVGSNFNGSIKTFEVYEGQLYGGTFANDWGGLVLRYDGGTTWTAVSKLDFDIDANVTSLVTYGDKLYAGLISKQTSLCHVYRWDGSGVDDWTSVAEPGFGGDNDRRITASAVFNGKLYMSTDYLTRVYCYDGSSWKQANTDGFGDQNNSGGEASMAAMGNSLLVGTYNWRSGAQIWQMTGAVPPVSQSTFYFAEGTTRTGFDAYFSIANPSVSASNVRITYMMGDGVQKTQELQVPAASRATVHPADLLGTGDDTAHDFSAKVESTNGVGIVAERPMYFNYQGIWTGGSDVVGATSPNNDWYFAEGTTRSGFVEYITVQNPGSQMADLTFHYMIEGEGEKDFTGQVNPGSRATFDTRAQIGDDKNVSLHLESTKPVVAERPVYFDYKGWTGGTDVIGATSPSANWYFAEGTCRPGFEPYLCIQNPGDETASILITYMKGNNTTQTQTASVPANSRSTIEVSSVLNTGDDAAHDFSMYIACTDGRIVCERPTYFDYKGWTGGHDVVGETTPGPIYYFAEGTTRPGFDTYLTIQNPGDTAVNVNVSYMMGDGRTAAQNVTVSAQSRATLHPVVVLGVGDDIAHDFSATVSCDPGHQIIVERPMYFNYLGWTGGHDVVGFVPQP